MQLQQLPRKAARPCRTSRAVHAATACKQPIGSCSAPARNTPYQQLRSPAKRARGTRAGGQIIEERDAGRQNPTAKFPQVCSTRLTVRVVEPDGLLESCSSSGTLSSMKPREDSTTPAAVVACQLQKPRDGVTQQLSPLPVKCLRKA